ncbi:hypothetical protein [Hansschlegelia sp. KR7-227]|jgi:hypothetical protein|uniref:hypothetical protein n=1 Tax=Hansschlegelia sp. KR7-227 TaxID=3400914 RepID=UPI003BFAEF78
MPYNVIATKNGKHSIVHCRTATDAKAELARVTADGVEGARVVSPEGTVILPDRLDQICLIETGALRTTRSAA